MTLNDELVAAVDRAARRLGTTRSAFTRMALRDALAAHRIRQLEQHHRQGYRRRPVIAGEFDVWEGEQAWGDS